MNKKDRGIEVIDKEITALKQLEEYIDDNFDEAVSLLHDCTGKVVLTGTGKSGHIARKIASTMASLGTMAFFLHPDDALHGDLGMVGREDVLIAISNSGESEEILELLSGIKTIGARIIAITSNEKSTLANNCDILCRIPKVEEACVLGIAPTSSTTATLALGDALAVVLSSVQSISKREFAVYHPSGALGKSLTTKVSDIMRKNERNAVVSVDSYIKDAISEIGKKEIGATLITDRNGCLKGLITDGDLRRCMERNMDIYTTSVKSVMTLEPITISPDEYVIKALDIMKQGGKKYSVLPVIDENKKIYGILSMADIIRAGIVY